MASSVDKEGEALSVELRAPSGWKKKKKYVQKKGGTPKKSKIIFISPTGEEIGHKRQLDKYLTAHPGGPASSEFDWGKTGNETRRRSTRISEKSKTAPPQESEPPTKRSRKSKDDVKETENAGEGNEGEKGIKDEAEKITENEAESDKDIVNENQDDEEKETDTKIEVASRESKIEGNLSTETEPVSSNPNTKTVDPNEDREKAVASEKGKITGPEPKGAAENGNSNCEVKP
jgi:hypothetical protein